MDDLPPTLRETLITKGWVTNFNADTLVRLIERWYEGRNAVLKSQAKGAFYAIVTGACDGEEWMRDVETVVAALEAL